MRGALDVHHALLAGGIPHEMVRLPRPVLSADELPASLQMPPASCVAVRCYRADDRFAAVMMQAQAVPRPATLIDVLSARAVRPATATEVSSATDFAAGLVSPVCLPAGVALLADAALEQAHVLYVPAGEGGVALGIRARDLLCATGARIAALGAGRLPDDGRLSRRPAD